MSGDAGLDISIPEKINIKKASDDIAAEKPDKKAAEKKAEPVKIVSDTDEIDNSDGFVKITQEEDTEPEKLGSETQKADAARQKQQTNETPASKKQGLDKTADTGIDPYSPFFDSSWEDIVPSDSGGLFTYQSGSSVIKAENSKDIKVKQNKDTGEIAVIGGKLKNVYLAQNAEFSLIESTAENISAENGGEVIKIEGAHSSIGNIKGGRGSQTVILSKGAKAASIDTGSGNDTIIVRDGAKAGSIDAGSGNDSVSLKDANIEQDIILGGGSSSLSSLSSKIFGRIDAGSGNNIIDAADTSFFGNIDLSSGLDEKNIFKASNSKINADIDAYLGNADISIENDSSLAQDAKIRAGSGKYNIDIKNSKLDGNLIFKGSISIAGDYEEASLHMENSSVHNVSGLRNDSRTSFSAINSNAPGAENIQRSTPSEKSAAPASEQTADTDSQANPPKKIYTVRISDTVTKTVSEEEFKEHYQTGFEILSADNMTARTIGTTIIYTKDGSGEIKEDPDTGAITISGADKAEIISGSDAKITVVNSHVLSHKNVSGTAEYINSTAESIETLEGSKPKISAGSGAKIDKIVSKNADLSVSLEQNSKIGHIAAEKGSLDIQASSGNIENIVSDEASISGSIQNASVKSIKTINGSIDITASDSEIGSIENNNRNGSTKINLSASDIKKISSKSAAVINLDECRGNASIETSDLQDEITVKNSNIAKLDAGNGNNTINAENSDIGILNAGEGSNTIQLHGVKSDKADISGSAAILNSNIKSLSVNGNISIKASQTQSFNVKPSQNEYGELINDSIAEITDSIIEGRHIDKKIIKSDETQADIENTGNAAALMDKMSDKEIDNIYNLFKNIDSTVFSDADSALSKKEQINKLLQSAEGVPSKIKQGLIDEMKSSLKTLETALKDDDASLSGTNISKIINGLLSHSDWKTLDAKKQMLDAAIAKGDIESLLNTHSLLTGEISAAKSASEHIDAVKFSGSLKKDDKERILNALGFIGNNLEYQISENDGVIKKGLACLNTALLDIGTTKKEAETFVKRFQNDVQILKDKLKNGKLSDEEFALEYKRITGNALNQKNAVSLLDDAGDNDAVSNKAQDKIEGYHDTQEKMFQIGEYAITIAAGTGVILVSGGAAGPVVSKLLAQMGSFGMSMTSSAVSAAVRAGIQIAERQSNLNVNDDVKASELIRNTAMIYAGCLCGQFGNAVEGYLKEAAPGFIEKFVSSPEAQKVISDAIAKTGGWAADGALNTAASAALAGRGNFSEEFMQNIKSSLIGLMQNKIAGAYFKNHPEINIRRQIMEIEDSSKGLKGAELNAEILKRFGFSDKEAADNAGLSRIELETLITAHTADRLAKESASAQISLKREEIEDAERIRTEQDEVQSAKPSDGTEQGAQMPKFDLQFFAEGRKIPSPLEMTNSEFKQLRAEFLSRLAELPDDIRQAADLSFRYGIYKEPKNTIQSALAAVRGLTENGRIKNDIYPVLNKNNIGAAVQILSNETLRSNESLMRSLGSFLQDIQTPRQAEAAAKILASPELCGCGVNVYEYAVPLINSCSPHNSKNAQNAENILKMIDNSDFKGLKRIVLSHELRFETSDMDIVARIAEKIEAGLPKNKSRQLVKAYNCMKSDVLSLSFKDKMESLSTMKQLLEEMQESKLFSEEEISEIKAYEENIQKSIKNTITPQPVSKSDIRQMMTGFLANNNQSLENFISSFDFTQFGRNGISLAYPRHEFLSDLSNILKNLPEAQQNALFKQLEITPVRNGNGEITGYDGIINLSALKQDGIEGRVFSAAERFIKGNSVNTGNAELDSAVNSLIQGMPEFINIIGKQQHDTQAYSVDTHILTVLKEAMAHPEYRNLSGIDKTCLKFAVIMHDIAKHEGVVDKTHPQLSALYAGNIMEKYSFPPAIKDRIFELVKNHHWLEEYSTGAADADRIAALFRHKDDFTTAKIMAEADLKGISETFYNEHKAALDSRKLASAAQSLENINETGQLVFTSKIIKRGLLPEREYHGRIFQVLNFAEIGDNEDLSRYGFPPGTTKANAGFYAHMTDRVSNLETVVTLSDPANGGFLCATRIAPDKSTVYPGLKFGVSLESENVNIANAGTENQASQGHKDFERFVKVITGNDNISRYRNLIPDSIKKSLKLTNEEYSQFFQMFASKEHISQIRDDLVYSIGAKKISGRQIKAAIQKADNSLISIEHHNESNLYNPKINAFIAKVSRLEDIPQEYLDFAYAHNLPVYLFGE